MARRRTAAEQVGVPELDEQEAARDREVEEQLQAQQLEAEQRDEEPPDPYEVLPEKFRKDPAKFGKAYEDLERELTRRANADAERDRQIAELQQQLQQSQRTDPADAREQIEEFYENDPVAAMQWMAQQAADQRIAQAMGAQAQASAPQDQVQNELYARSVNDMMRQEFDDWGEVSPEIQQRLMEDPSLLPDTSLGSLQSVKRHLSMIYKDVKYDQLMTERGEATERGATEATRAVERKREAQTLSGASGRAPEPSEGKKELEKMRAALAGSSYSTHRALEQR